MQVKKKSVKSKQIDNKGRLSPVARKKREETLKKKLPSNIVPAFDGMSFNF